MSIAKNQQGTGIHIQRSIQPAIHLFIHASSLTLPEHLVPHPLQGALYCIRCSLAWFLYFTHVVCLVICDIDYRYWIYLLVL